MKTLFVINSVYQLFITINMRINGLPQGEADIAVSDHTPSLKDYITCLKASGLFENVFYLTTIEFDRNFWSIHNDKKPVYFKAYKEHADNILLSAGIKIKRYDNLYTANLDAYIRCVYKSYPDLNYFIIEDGAAVCAMDWKAINERWRYIEGYCDIHEQIKGVYLYTPDLMCIDIGYEMHLLPPIDRNDSALVSLYNNIFSYDINFRFPRFVFIEQSFQADRIVNNDLDFMRSLAAIVGYDNLLIKQHPRNTVNRPVNFGLSKPFESSWPFELMLINCETDNNVFITVNSGSLISAKRIFEHEIETIFLFKALNGPSHAIGNDKFNEFMEKYVEKYKSAHMFVPETMAQYEHALKFYARGNGCG